MDTPDAKPVHPIFQNASANWQKVLSRNVDDCTINVPEWGPTPETPYTLYLAPPKGIGWDAYNRYNMVTEGYQWAVAFIMQTCVDPVDKKTRIFKDSDKEFFDNLDDPKVCIRVANEIALKLAESYPTTPEQVKEPLSTREAES